jgi:hypothetical protein
MHPLADRVLEGLGIVGEVGKVRRRPLVRRVDGLGKAIEVGRDIVVDAKVGGRNV